MSIHHNSLDPAAQQWDIIVVGAGAGGAALGYALAKAGKKVLFCEKGRSLLSESPALRGDYAERFFPKPSVAQPRHQDILARAGRCYDEIEDHSRAKVLRHIPFIGLGTGGGTALFGMAMERFFPCDFQPRGNYPDIGESTLPDSWPIGYEELEPYYREAEQLFRVHGSADPLRPDETKPQYLSASPLHPANRELYEFFQAQGLHPYRLPLACDQVEGCEGCQGYLCGKNCKNDAGKICLEPAISRYGARLLEECAALRLEHGRDSVTGVVCSWKGQERTFRAGTVVLAAGALQSPALLLRSRSAQWPQGLANNSGMVGRNLMRHYVDLFAVAPKSPGKLAGNLKEIAFNDYYQIQGGKFGTVQSFGTLPPASMIVEQIEQDLRDAAFPLAAALFQPFKPLLKPVLGRLFSSRLILASLLEDLPYLDNRVVLSDQDKIILNYRVHPAEKARIELFRKKIANLLKPYSFMLMKQAENNDRIAHVCGTCRFGKDERDSVLDAGNRAHGLSNLYVVDSSFFPSSAGTNPGLTIIANALRVADIIAHEK